MGLAPYGEPGINLREFIAPNDNPYRVATNLLIAPESDPFRGMEPRLGPPRLPESEIDARHKNLAFAVQDMCEQAMLTLARAAVAKTGCRNLCLAGGVALNSKANGKILSSGIVDRIFVQPAASDDGVCLGAALGAVRSTRAENFPSAKCATPIWAMNAPTRKSRRPSHTYKIRATRVADPAAVAAELLADGKILGWVQGRMEFGPRALGSRSILADPRDPEMNAKVNNAVKFREWWRPFAPSLLAGSRRRISGIRHRFALHGSDRAGAPGKAQRDSFGHARGWQRAPANSRARRQSALLAAHSANSADRTGVPVVMNTSFNLRGEPIVSSPTDAIRTFFSSGMDALVIGSFVVEK